MKCLTNMDATVNPKIMDATVKNSITDDPMRDPRTKARMGFRQIEERTQMFRSDSGVRSLNFSSDFVAVKTTDEVGKF